LFALDITFIFLWPDIILNISYWNKRHFLTTFYSYEFITNIQHLYTYLLIIVYHYNCVQVVSKTFIRLVHSFFIKAINIFYFSKLSYSTKIRLMTICPLPLPTVAMSSNVQINVFFITHWKTHTHILRLYILTHNITIVIIDDQEI